MVIKKSVKMLPIILMVFGLVSVTSLCGAAPPTWPIPEGIKTIEVNGYPMAYQEAGKGVPLVLLHMHPSDYRSWENQVPDFSKMYRTIAVSLRHYYPEKWNGVGDDFSVAQHAADIAEMIKKLNLGKVHLVGASRGGSVAVTVTSNNPELFRTMILAEPNMEPLMADSPEKQKRLSQAKALGEKVRATLAAGEREKATREWLEFQYGPEIWGKVPDRNKQFLIENIGVCTDIGDRGRFTCGDIQKINIPVLLLNGEKSPKIFSDFLAALRQCNPNIPNPIIVPNAGHTMIRDNPAFFNKTVLDFLSQH